MVLSFSNPSLARLSARTEALLSTHAFTILFIVKYVAAVSLMFLWGFWSQFNQEKRPEIRWFIGIARGAGYSLNLNTALVILLASRLFLTALRDSAIANLLPLDKAFPAIHIIVAYFIVAGVAIHVPFHFVWIIRANAWQWGLWQINMTVITGSLLLAVFSVLFIFARPAVRKKNFKLFYFVHLVGATLFFMLLIVHGMYYFRPETYKWVVPTLIIYALDRVIRRVRASTHQLQLSAANSVLIDKDVLQISVPKTFDYRPGQYAEIKIPSINREWHPFTIASAPYEEDMTFFIKSGGDWTKRLQSSIEDLLNGVNQEPVQLRVRGPFGAPCQEVHQYERAVLISGGIGATPFTSICKQLHHENGMKQDPAKSSGRDSSFLQEKIAHLSNSVEQRIRNAVSKIYGIDVSAIEGEGAEEAQVNHVAEMLRVSSRGLKARSNGRWFGKTEQKRFDTTAVRHEQGSATPDSEPLSSKTSTDGQDARGSSATLQRLEKAYDSIIEPVAPSPMEMDTRRKRAHLNEIRGNVLMFLHSTRVTFSLMLLATARIGVVIAGSIFKSDYVSLMVSDTADLSGRWVPLVYSIVSIPLIATLFLTFTLECTILGGRSFSSFRRISEAIAFGPVGIASIVFEIQRYVLQSHRGASYVLGQLVIVQAAAFLFVWQRMWRSVGRRGLIDNKENSFARGKGAAPRAPSADFLWTTPYADNDIWLRRTLNDLVDSSAVGLHRFVTRGELQDSTSTELADIEGGGVDAFTSCSKKGRPDWDAALSGIARDCVSGSVVGIFFCGPHAMGDAVRKSAKRVEMWCNLRDAYLRTTDDATLMNDLGISNKSAVRSLRRHGCRIRFVYREENFS